MECIRKEKLSEPDLFDYKDHDEIKLNSHL